jgi:hypothetical protein
MKTLPIIGFAAALAMAGTAFAQSQTTPPAGNKKMSAADCTALWSSLDTAKAGSLTEAQAKSAVPNFAAADTNKDGKLSQSEFTSACSSGLVTGSGSRGMTGTDTPSGNTAPKK